MSFERIHIPRINAIRITPDGASFEVDYNNRLPRLDLMKHREQYQRGEKQHKAFYCDWLVNKTVSWQFQIEAAAIPNPQPNIVARIYAENGTFTALTVTDITPAGWVAGWKVKKINYTPTLAGIYYLYLYIDWPNPSWTDLYMVSDSFRVKTDLSSAKNFIEIKYKNSYNKFGYVFDGYYYAYFEGRIGRAQSETENTTIKEDDGTYITQSKSSDVLKATFSTLNRTQVRALEKMLSCNDVYINGVPVTMEQGLEVEDIERSDLVNIIANLTMKNSDDFMNFL